MRKLGSVLAEVLNGCLKGSVCGVIVGEENVSARTQILEEPLLVPLFIIVVYRYKEALWFGAVVLVYRDVFLIE